jgi:hypothetical protein
MTDAVPALTAVTIPVIDTDATAGFALDQVTVRPVRMLPAVSRKVAVACVLSPTLRDVEFNVTATAATGTGDGAVTVIGTVAVTPSTCALIVALPALVDLTTPVAPTVATAVLELAQLTTRFTSKVPFASRTAAVS